VYTSRQLADTFLATSYVNKELGQNFIIDDGVIDSISTLAQLDKKKSKCKILEIGLGPGALTQKLLQSGHDVIGIEIDRIICEHISKIFPKQIESQQLKLIHGDALNLDWPLEITDIIANIPYQISSPLLEKITQICNTQDHIENCTFMFQEEFARRIFVETSSNRGPLWVSVSLDWDVSLGSKVSRSSFKPQPKVESRLVHFKRRELLKSQEIKLYLESKNLKVPTLRLIRAISSTSFKQRRKKLRNSLKRQPSKLKSKHGFDVENWEKILEKAFISMGESFSNQRPEELSLQDWIEFSAHITHFQKTFQTLT
tara:strand:+ start:366 stop:1307 length:942 start_codon:yes stop_codon:yes gene_type:complete